MCVPNLRKIREAWAHATWIEHEDSLVREAFPWVLGTIAAVEGAYLLELSPSPAAEGVISNFRPRLFDSRRRAAGFADEWLENFAGLGVDVEFPPKRRYGTPAPMQAVS